MKTADYSELLRDPRWQKKRLKIMDRDKFTCQECVDKTELHVHHKKYIPGFAPWEYDDDDLITFCKYCHYDAEGIIDYELFVMELINN